jgi:[ribosomal protein S5]-alanine N-acetyltransferase
LLAVRTEQGKPALHETARLAVRRLVPEDGGEFTGLVNASADFLNPWVSLPETPATFADYVRRFDGNTAECLLVCMRGSGAIVGTFSISGINRGPYQRATVGYNAFASTARHGYMSEAFALVFRFAFGDLGLHRLEADIQPGNEASLRLARRAGFRREGYSPGFACVHGSWKDHERWAITSDMIAI